MEKSIASLLKEAHDLAHKDTSNGIYAPCHTAAFVMESIGFDNQENLWVLNLNTRNYVVSITELYRGTKNSTPINMSELFREAIASNAASIILTHNHPSGDVSPSPEDVNVTKSAIEAGELLDIHVLDHVIVSHGDYVSLREKFSFLSWG